MYVLIVGISSAVFLSLYLSMSNSIFDLDTPPPSTIVESFLFPFDGVLIGPFLSVIYAFPFSNSGFYGYGSFFFFFENLKKLNSDLHGDAS